MDTQTKVLIVDDNEHARRRLKSILAEFNCIFSEAEDEESALTLIKENIFDVILLDIKLPYGVTGIDVYRNAKKIRPNVGRVIILTGWLEDSIRNEANELGAFAYLDKAPLDRNKIIEVFKKALIK